MSPSVPPPQGHLVPSCTVQCGFVMMLSGGLAQVDMKMWRDPNHSIEWPHEFIGVWALHLLPHMLIKACILIEKLG